MNGVVAVVPVRSFLLVVPLGDAPGVLDFHLMRAQAPLPVCLVVLVMLVYRATIELSFAFVCFCVSYRAYKKCRRKCVCDQRYFVGDR